ncbi:MAG: hypothetical protein WC322_06340 [Candidatus Paceibacterota bacterium]|jgi:hypothetical protein
MQNKEHFLLIAGEPDKWDTEIREQAGSVGLVALQNAQFMDGRRGAILQPIRGGKAWIVTHDSSLVGFAPLCGMGATDKGTAIRCGVDWAEADPLKREFYARKQDVTPAEIEDAKRGA